MSAKTIFFNVLILSGLLLALEIGVRYFVTYNPKYYTGIRASDSCVQYPYGEVCLNSDGYPDSEFNTESIKPRVGYFGDSVCYGVGAGGGFRITDLLKTHYDQYEHFNFCRIGDALLSEDTLLKLCEIVSQYRLAHVVYLMNLNDIPPLLAETEEEAAEGGPDWVVAIQRFLAPFDELLRGRSYLYTYLRNTAKERFTAAGYGADGYRAVELFPGENEKLFSYAAAKINTLRRFLEKKNVKFSLVILPYEMQVSADAANTYRTKRIAWETGFEYGAAQFAVIANLDKTVRYYDALQAFDNRRDTALVGEYFVYDQGDKIDWNHPNREGHRLIADYLVKKHILQ